MTNEEIKHDLRKQRLLHIAKTISAKQMQEELDPLQTNLIDALVRMASTNPDLTFRFFCLMRNHTGLISGEVREHLKTVCGLASVRLPIAMFDQATAHMRYIARENSLSSVRRYINYMLSEDDCDAVEELLDSHFTTCEDCGEWEARGEFIETYNDGEVCRRCSEYNYEYSEYYDSYVHTESSRSAIDRDGDRITIHCDDEDFEWNEDEDCYVHNEYSGRIIGSYHSSKGNFCPIESPWTRANSFYISKIVDINNPPPRYSRYFGVELEVEVKHGDRLDRATALNDALNKGIIGKSCFFENDGSLSNGFEIITQPMGLDTHAKFWEWVKDANLSRGLLSHNTSTCGLHVHVTRYGLTRLQISKMVAFINHPDNRPLLEALARRYGSNYATYSSGKRIGNALRDSNGRYEALNLEPRKTIEFRMFKGTLKYESIMSAVEFANALVNFCSDQSGYGFKLDTKSFMQFIETPAIVNDTKHLRPYIANKLESQ